MQELKVVITGVTIILDNNRGDYVSLHTCFLSPCPGVSKQPLCFGFYVAQGDGYRYVTEHLGIKPELIETINTNRYQPKFSR